MAAVASHLVRADREEGYEWLATHDEDWHRALDVQGVLWRGEHVPAGCQARIVGGQGQRERAR